MYCFRIILKCLTLVHSNNAIEKLWIWLTGLGEIFINCDPVLLLLIHETVWNKLHTPYLSFISSWKMWLNNLLLMCTWSSIHFRVIWQSLATTSWTLQLFLDFEHLMAAHPLDHCQSPHFPVWIYETNQRQMYEIELHFHWGLSCVL